jgi:hypothetical protein
MLLLLQGGLGRRCRFGDEGEAVPPEDALPMTVEVGDENPVIPRS